MQIRVNHDDRSATISIAKSEKDSGGGVMIEIEDLEHAQAHGWYIDHDAPPPKIQLKPRAPKEPTE